MPAYRVKHKATGLYYCRSRRVRFHYTKDGIKHWHYTKSNLSKKGKIYPGIPSSTWYVGHIYNHILLQQEIDKGAKVSFSRSNGYSEQTTLNDWEIEEIGAKPKIADVVQDLKSSPLHIIAAEIGLVARAFDPGSPSRNKLQELQRDVEKIAAVLQPVVKVRFKKPRIMSIVKWVPIPDFVPAPGHPTYERTLLYCGEIPNMPTHGVFLGGSGKTYIGYHVDEFREATEEEV